MMDYKAYSGVPFLEHGRDVNGWDCWGLYRHIYHDFSGLWLPEFSDCYDDIIHDRKAIGEEVKHQLKSWVDIPASKEKEGDVIMLRLRGIPMHIGYVLPKSQFIHCVESTNTVVENYKHTLWKNRVLGFHRYG